MDEININLRLNFASKHVNASIHESNVSPLPNRKVLDICGFHLDAGFADWRTFCFRMDDSCLFSAETGSGRTTLPIRGHCRSPINRCLLLQIERGLCFDTRGVLFGYLHETKLPGDTIPVTARRTRRYFIFGRFNGRGKGMGQFVFCIFVGFAASESARDIKECDQIGAAVRVSVSVMGACFMSV